ncbi:MAG TPA: phage portal protein, partial [Brevibacterium sp.]|nr:phage portal protein [Brevibacterium sp.]
MGIWDRLMGRSAPPVIFTPRVTQAGSWEEWWQEINTDLSTASPAALFRKQTHLRSVVTFRARNVAQLGLHVYERVSDTDRRRDRSSVAARALAVADGVMTPYELVFALVGDLDLYDRAHWLVVPDADLPSGWMIRRLPPSWVTPERESAFEVHSWRVTSGKESVVIPAEHVLSFTGYSPTDPRRGSPAVDSLRDTLQEQIEAAVYRGQIWKRGGRVSSVIERPKDAPQWSDPARESFREDWYAKYTGRGSKAGGTPILEDGMTLKRVDFNAQEQQYVEAAKLSLTTVAAAFHVNPTMLGQNDGANYSNVREFRKALYTDTLGPLLAQIEGRLNAFLLPMLGVDPARYYLEFNIEEKLQGNFEEQATALQSATGA